LNDVNLPFNLSLKMEMFSYDISIDSFRETLKEPFFSYSSGGSLGVEFPVWLLRRDGLKVPPFSHHETGDESLQQLGMDAASWERWFRRVVSAHNPCLFWDISEPNESEILTSLGESVGELVLERGRNLSLWQSAQLEKAMTQLGDSSLPRALPVSIWDGSQTIKDILAELWEQYNLSPNVENVNSPWDVIDVQMVSDTSQRLIRDFGLDVLHVFHVLYPEAAHMAVGSSILVIGVNDFTTTEQLILNIMEGVKQLSQAK
jgi:hypothetical protein